MRFSKQQIITAAVSFAFAATALPASSSAIGSSPSVRPNPDEQLLITATQPTRDGQSAAAAVQPNPDQQAQIATDTRQQPIAGTPAVIVRVSNTRSGFDWGDASIGAAGALGLCLIALAGWIGVSHQRARRTETSAVSR